MTSHYHWIPPFSKIPACINLKLTIHKTVFSRVIVYTFFVTNLGPYNAHDIVLTVDYGKNILTPVLPKFWSTKQTIASSNLGTITVGDSTFRSLMTIQSSSPIKATITSILPNCNPDNGIALI